MNQTIKIRNINKQIQTNIPIMTFLKIIMVAKCRESRHKTLEVKQAVIVQQ